MSPSPGWYTDPNSPRNERYFDGRVWTHHVRADVPDIPLAPWVDPRPVPSIYGHAIDTSAPTNNTATWLSLGLAALGVSAAFVTGIVQTNAGIAEAMAADPGLRLLDPPPGGSGTPLLELYSCSDLIGAMIHFDEQDPILELTGNYGDYAAVRDNQPIYTLPNEADEMYRVIECEVAAERAGGSVEPAWVILVLDFQGGLILDYGDV